MPFSTLTGVFPPNRNVNSTTIVVDWTAASRPRPRLIDIHSNFRIPLNTIISFSTCSRPYNFFCFPSILFLICWLQPLTYVGALSSCKDILKPVKVILDGFARLTLSLRGVTSLNCKQSIPFSLYLRKPWSFSNSSRLRQWISLSFK